MSVAGQRDRVAGQRNEGAFVDIDLFTLSDIVAKPVQFLERTLSRCSIGGHGSDNTWSPIPREHPVQGGTIL